MKRLALLGSWKRLGFQFSLLAGLGLAFVGGSEKPARADGHCPVGEQCTFKKPNFMIVLDYSSSMNTEFQPGQTRWQAAVEAVQNLVTTNNGYFDESMHLALMRFGNDPNPSLPNTTIPNDTSGLVDGQSLDVHWYDPEAAPTEYFECNGQAIIDFLNEVPPPLCQGANCAGIGTWTEGALQRAQQIIEQTRDDHDAVDNAGGARYYGVLLLTDGVWTNQAGTQQLGPPQDSPIPAAASLFTQDQPVPVYVVAFGEAAGEQFADDIAAAGGTNQAINAGAGELVPALEEVLTDVQEQVVVPECTSGLPRIMIILDASSSMLNVGGVAGPMGQTGWDQAYAALAGDNSIFDAEVPGMPGQRVEDLVHLGLITFGSETPVEERTLIVDYNPCMKDNFEWALNPQTSCGPGCADPWGGPPIPWSFQGPTSPSYPGFDADTYSRMPLCDDGEHSDGICTGSGTATHRGLELARDNAETYRGNESKPYPADGNTQYINILITDGQYGAPGNWSTDAQVSDALRAMYEDGIRTYVIGMGDAVAQAELTNMACWGSGGTGIPCVGGTTEHFTTDSQAQLQAALQSILGEITFDPCCAFNDCSFNPEPTTNEPDPIPGADTGSEESSGGQTTDDPTGADETTTGASETGDATGDSGGQESGDDEGVDPTNATSPGETGSDESGGGDTAGGDAEASGCGCSTDGGSRGAGGALAMFLLAGALRRRRKA